MTNEKKDLVQELRTHRRVSDAASNWAVIIGFALMLMTVAGMLGTQTFVDQKHLSSPNIPLKDARNATYTFTARAAANAVYLWFVPFSVGVGAIVVGLTITVVNPGPRKFHKVHCKGEGEMRYCQECGLELKKLETYKD